MRLTPRPLEIGETDGFTSEHDTFGASESAERLAALVADLEGHSVIVIDGDWGSGKSTFIKQWAGLMRTRNHVVVEFDAFEADHHDDPFFALLATLLDEIDNGSTSATRARHSLRDRLSSAAFGVGRTVPSLLAQAALPGPLGNALVAAIESAMTSSDEGTEADAAAFVRERIDGVAVERRAVKAFRDELSAVAHQVSDSGETPSPIVFIIDELDRCKPSFSLDVLERMKHVFAADGICFVLVTHLSELTAMVGHTYGVTAPAKYLDKFYHLKIDIDQLLLKEDTDINREYILYLCEEFGIPRPDDNHTWFIALTNLVRLYELTLRSMERVLRNLALYARTNRNYALKHLLEIAAPLCVMREVRPDLYAAATGGRLTIGATEEFLQLGEWDISPVGREALLKRWKQVASRESASVKEGVSEGPVVLPKEGGGDMLVMMSGVVRRICEDIDRFAQSE